MPSLARIILQSLRFHWRSHAGVVLGSAVGAAALVGALLVGDSVRESLKDSARARLGAVEVAMDSADRLFTTDLAARLTSDTLERSPTTAYALALRGTVSRQDGTARAHDVHIYGAHSNFWAFSPAADQLARRSGQSSRVIGPASATPDESAAWSRETESWQRPEPGKVRINAVLAQQLNAKPGDTLILRFAKPSALSREAVLSPRSDASAAIRLVVDDVLDAPHFGEFSLRSGQRPALNAFVNLEQLWRAAEVTNRANLVLARADASSGSGSDSNRVRRWIENQDWLPTPIARALTRAFSDRSSDASSAAALQRLSNELERAWRLEDGELEVRVIEPAAPTDEQPAFPTMVEVATRRIFLSPPVVAAATAPDPRLPEADQAERAWLTNGVRVLTYLVNAINAGDRLTPYSMVTAVGPPWTPPDLGSDEIIVNEWLANDLGLQPGDPIDLVYFDPEAGARLIEKTNRFRVRAIVPLQGLHADRTLMPDFPGLADAETTSDWDAGFPLVHTIRDQDEEYWDKYRGTPKAFISYEAGHALWANRFGEATAVRFFVPTNDAPESFRQSLAANLRASLGSGDVGLVFQPVREQAFKAATSGQDFGGLFLGFSLFLVVAALLLMALLFQFGLEQRLPEIGTLLAVGFRPRQVRRLWLGEALMLALVGGLIGVIAGFGYAVLMIRGLTTIWSDAVAGARLDFHATPASIATGLLASVLISTMTIWLAFRRQSRRPARELLAGEIAAPRPTRRSRGLWIGMGAVGIALVLAAYALATGQTANPGVFFGAGSLLLIGGLALSAAWLARIERSHGPATRSAAIGESATASTPLSGGDLRLSDLALRGTTRRRSRSLATAGLLASGTFLICAIGVFRMDAQRDAWRRGSGTGGFALIGETSLPIVHDLNTTTGQEFFGLGPEDLPGVSFVPFRVRPGDDASCLNLNRAQRPQILGVRPELLAGRGAFTFSKLARGIDVTNGWLALEPRQGNALPGGPQGESGANTRSLATSADLPEIPAIGDAASIQWALGKKIGDTIDMTDERGRSFRLRLVGAVANSVLQGNLIISESAFERLFPGESGYRYFLIDAPTNRVNDIAATLSRAMEDVGLQTTPAARRLAEFNAVQNTYLTTFQILGGLGLLLGSAGLGVVVLRNVLERRGELALMTAVGFRRQRLAKLILLEHSALLLLGLIIGMVSAAVAVLPSVLAPETGLPLRSLALTLAGVLVVGLITAWLATRASLRGQLLAALRGE